VRDRLAKVEALARAAGTDGERIAAEAAASRLRVALSVERADGAAGEIADVDMAFPLDHPWAARLLTALCHRYAVEPVGLAADGRMIVRAPRIFLEAVLVPEFDRVRHALAGLMGELTARPTAPPSP
jgi:hypothetical protein